VIFDGWSFEQLFLGATIVICERYFEELAAVIGLVASLSFQGCSQTIGEAPRMASQQLTLPITATSSAAFGILRSDSAPVSRYIRLVYDPTKEGEGFVGGLRMSVEAFAGSERVCTFDLPVSVISTEDVNTLTT
jgi:hypothetical protein